MRTTKHFWRGVVGFLAAALIAACGQGPEESATRTACADFRFDREEWAAVDTTVEGETPRQEAADRLIECETLAGATKKEVRRLLGPPDESDGDVFAYFLGEERSFFVVDGEFLDIEFSPEGRVAAVEISAG